MHTWRFATHSTVAWSTALASTSGMDRKCTDLARPTASSGSVSSLHEGWCRRRPWYSVSVKNGVKGAMRRHSDSSTCSAHHRIVSWRQKRRMSALL
jgi:hypothetical protein